MPVGSRKQWYSASTQLSERTSYPSSGGTKRAPSSMLTGWMLPTPVELPLVVAIPLRCSRLRLAACRGVAVGVQKQTAADDDQEQREGVSQ